MDSLPLCICPSQLQLAPDEDMGGSLCTFDLLGDLPFQEDFFAGDPPPTNTFLPLLEDNPVPAALPLAEELQWTAALPIREAPHPPAALPPTQAEAPLLLPEGDPYVHLSPLPAEYLGTSQVGLWDNRHYLYPDVLAGLSTVDAFGLAIMPDGAVYAVGDLHAALLLFHQFNREAFGLPPVDGFAPQPIGAFSALDGGSWADIWSPPPPPPASAPAIGTASVPVFAHGPASAPAYVAAPSATYPKSAKGGKKAKSGSGVGRGAKSNVNANANANKAAKAPRKPRVPEIVATPGTFIFVDNVVPRADAYVSSYTHTRQYMVDAKGKVHRRRRFEDGKQGKQGKKGKKVRSLNFRRGDVAC